MQEFLELATPADAEAVLALYRRQIGRPGCAWNEHYPDASFVRADLQRRALRVVREGERLLAAVSLLEQDDDELEALGCWTVSPACEAVRLCVAPDAQGRGDWRPGDARAAGRSRGARFCRDAPAVLDRQRRGAAAVQAGRLCAPRPVPSVWRRFPLPGEKPPPIELKYAVTSCILPVECCRGERIHAAGKS